MRRGGRPAAASLVLVIVAAVAAVLGPLASATDDRALTMAVLMGAGGAAASLALAAGRPLLAVAALGGAGGYVSGGAALHGVTVPLAVLLGAVGAALLGGVLGVLCLRLEATVALALSAVVPALFAASVRAIPQAGGGSGLGPLPPPGVPGGGGSTVVLSSAGQLHLALGVVTVGALLLSALVARGPGPRWRAAGGDRDRAAAVGLRPGAAQATALAVTGAAAGLWGALAAHVAGVADPGPLGADAAVLPLAAAVVVGSAGPSAAALLGGLTAAAGLWALPRLGYSGPPDALGLMTAALGALAVGRLALPRLRRARPAEAEAGQVSPRWPDLAPRRGATGLAVSGLRVSAGPHLVDPAFTLDVPAGGVHALVGPNGAGKSTTLAALARALHGRAVLVPQQGGGWPGTTVAETLSLSARAGGARGAAGREVAGALAEALGLAEVAGRRCEELTAGARRRVDLGRALAARRTVLLLDEPLAGLSGGDRDAAMAAIRAAAAAGVAVVIAEHDAAAVAALASGRTVLQRRGDPDPPGLEAAPA